MLQAESEKLRQAWIQAVQASIASAYKDIADNYYIEVRRCVQMGILTDMNLSTEEERAGFGRF